MKNNIRITYIYIYEMNNNIKLINIIKTNINI